MITKQNAIDTQYILNLTGEKQQKEIIRNFWLMRQRLSDYDSSPDNMRNLLKAFHFGSLEIPFKYVSTYLTDALYFAWRAGKEKSIAAWQNARLCQGSEKRNITEGWKET